MSFNELQQKIGHQNPADWRQASGGGWIKNTAKVENEANVRDNAIVDDNARVSGDAQVDSGIRK